jgi:hypothetical protein
MEHDRIQQILPHHTYMYVLADARFLHMRLLIHLQMQQAAIDGPMPSSIGWIVDVVHQRETVCPKAASSICHYR